jgi:hypothetical protein
MGIAGVGLVLLADGIGRLACAVLAAGAIWSERRDKLAVAMVGWVLVLPMALLGGLMVVAGVGAFTFGEGH